MQISSLPGKKKIYLTITAVAFLITCIVGNYTDPAARHGVEALYKIVTGKPMVNDISQTDEKGIPFNVERNIGKHRNPMTVSNRALLYYANYQQGDSSQKQFLINCADWLVDDLSHQGNWAVLKYEFDFPFYNMKAPWRSGLANGVSLQVFIRAHKLTHDDKYMKAANNVLQSFLIAVADGGVTYKTANDGWWYEEFADDSGMVSRVLNGHMFALLGLHEYFEYTNDSTALYTFEQGLLALKNNIAKYDRGNGHSFYDQRGTPANVKYHFIHVDQLDQLFKISGENVFKVYRDKWKGYEPPNLMERLIEYPLKPVDVAIWLLNFVILLPVLFVIYFLFSLRKRSNNLNR